MIRFYDFEECVGNVELIDGKMVYSHLEGDGIIKAVESMRRGAF
jgi:hypothetical protein